MMKSWDIMSIGERIKELRKEQNVSQVQLAKALGVSRQAVSKWETDLSVPDTLKLIQLADLLMTDTEFIVTGNHSILKPPPAEIQVVEKIVEKPVEVERIVEVERVVERIIEVPQVKKVVRVKYLRNPFEFLLIGVSGLIIGFLIGFFL